MSATMAIGIVIIAADVAIVLMLIELRRPCGSSCWGLTARIGLDGQKPAKAHGRTVRELRQEAQRVGYRLDVTAQCRNADDQGNSVRTVQPGDCR